MVFFGVCLLLRRLSVTETLAWPCVHQARQHQVAPGLSRLGLQCVRQVARNLAPEELAEGLDELLAGERPKIGLRDARELEDQVQDPRRQKLRLPWQLRGARREERLACVPITCRRHEGHGECTTRAAKPWHSTWPHGTSATTGLRSKHTGHCAEWPVARAGRRELGEGSDAAFAQETCSLQLHNDGMHFCCTSTLTSEKPISVTFCRSRCFTSPFASAKLLCTNFLYKMLKSN